MEDGARRNGENNSNSQQNPSNTTLMPHELEKFNPEGNEELVQLAGEFSHIREENLANPFTEVNKKVRNSPTGGHLQQGVK